MPELPEVEFCRRLLARRGTGTARVEVRDPRAVRVSRTSRPTAGAPDGPAKLAEVVAHPAEPPLRRGKRLLWPFGEGALLLHLGMTGKWSRHDGAHVKVVLHFVEGPLYFHDPRLLGGVVPLPRAEAEVALHEGLGPDALLDPFPALRGRRAVKLVLLDQSVVAGLGNLHAAEALWRARLSPLLPAEDLSDAQHAALAVGVRDQLQGAVDQLSEDDEITYVEEAGAPNPFPLYGQRGRPCPRCGTPIEGFPQGGRTTWWCPTCQGGHRAAPSPPPTKSPPPRRPRRGAIDA